MSKREVISCDYCSAELLASSHYIKVSHMIGSFVDYHDLDFCDIYCFWKLLHQSIVDFSYRNAIDRTLCEKYLLKIQDSVKEPTIPDGIRKLIIDEEPDQSAAIDLPF